MTFTTEITEKDKKLLVGLALFLIIAGFGWLLIRPAFNDIMSIKEQIGMKEIDRNSIVYNTKRIPQLEGEAQTLATKLREGTTGFGAHVESQEIDKLLTSMALAYGINKSDIKQLSIDNPNKYLVIYPYLTPEADKVKEQPSSSGADSGDLVIPGDEDPAAIEAGDEPNPNRMSGIFVADAEMKLYGTRSKLQGFIDLIATDTLRRRVTRFDWTQDGEHTDKYLLTLNVQVYMSDKGE